MLLYQPHLQFSYDLTWQQFQYLKTVVILILRSYNLHNFLICVLYANEILCYISFIDKTRSCLQNDDLHLDTTLYTLYSFLDIRIIMTWWWPKKLKAETCSCFNMVIL